MTRRYPPIETGPLTLRERQIDYAVTVTAMTHYNKDIRRRPSQVLLSMGTGIRDETFHYWVRECWRELQ